MQRITFAGKSTGICETHMKLYLVVENISRYSVAVGTWRGKESYMGRETKEKSKKSVTENTEKTPKNKANFKGKLISKIITTVIFIVAVVIIAVVIIEKFKKEPVKEVITVSTLEEIIEVSELSTFRVVYNGVAEAEGSYYVSYEAYVDAGIDFEAIEISVDSENKVVTIKIPQAEILDTYVDIGSLDYIFIDKNANSSTVSEQAFKICKYDVRYESENQEVIIELAQQNAENVIRALVAPFVEQVDAEYEIVIE